MYRELPKLPYQQYYSFDWASIEQFWNNQYMIFSREWEWTEISIKLLWDIIDEAVKKYI
jgi:hypothetical protein